MAKPKVSADKRTQSQKFMDKAHELGADGDEATFRRALKAVATAPAPSKKAAKTRKGG